MLRKECPDQELWQAICRDDAKAFNTLFYRYWQLIYSLAAVYLKDPDASAQLVHDVFLSIWQKRKLYQIRSFKSYLCAAARHLVFKRLKAQKNGLLFYIENYENTARLMHTGNQGESGMIYQELEKDLEASLHRLPKRCREIYILSRTNELSNQEIALSLGISRRTVENQLTAALQFIRTNMHYSAVLILFYSGSFMLCHR